MCVCVLPKPHNLLFLLVVKLRSIAVYMCVCVCARVPQRVCAVVTVDTICVSTSRYLFPFCIALTLFMCFLNMYLHLHVYEQGSKLCLKEEMRVSWQEVTRLRKKPM